MNKKKPIFLLTLLFFSVIIFSVNSVSAQEVYGHWKPQGQNGYWNSTQIQDQIINIKSYEGIGTQGYFWSDLSNNAISNMSAFKTTIIINELNSSVRNWSHWQTSSTNKINFTISLLSGAGLFGTFKASCIVESQTGFWNDMQKHIYFSNTMYNVGTMPTEFNIYFLRNPNNDSLLELKFAYFDALGKTTLQNGTTFDGFYVYFNQTFVVNPSFWNNDMLVALNIDHSGNGYFDMDIIGNSYNNGAYPSIVGGVDATKVEKQVLSWIDNLFGTIYGILSFLYQLSDLFITVVVVLLPYTPYFLIFWFIDVLIISVETQSFQPVGYCVITIYSVLITAYDLLVKVATFVWNAITFWVPDWL